jgi:hypothetical protein
MFTLTVRPDILRAALLFTKERGQGSGLREEYDHLILDRTIVATNGHTMFIANPSEVCLTGPGTTPVFLGKDLIGELLDGVADNEPVSCFIDARSRSALTSMGKRFELPMGLFVDWRKVYPRHINGATTDYSLFYLAKVTHANLLLGAKEGILAGQSKVHHNGSQGPCVIELTGNRAHVMIQHMLHMTDEYKPFLI